MDVIITCDLYQTPPVRNKWVFQKRFDTIDTLGINFWLDHIFCFKLLQIMRQSDNRFIEVLNRFQIATHNPINITFFNNIFLCQLPNELDFPYMYYTNKSTKERNNYFLKIQKDNNMFLMLMTNTMTHAPNISN
jgi:hypothetical protein